MSLIHAALPLAASTTESPAPIAPSGQLVAAALIGIAVIVLLITVLKVHPFLSLTLGTLVVAVVAGEDLATAITSYSTGFGTTAAGVGTLIALGAMFGKLLADSGGADQIVDTLVGRTVGRGLPWTMALVGALIGLPMFFEIGVVLLIPVIYLVSRRSGQSLVKVGIPALAGLSVMHGFVPPHPGPVAAIDNLGADLGITLLLGVLVAIPTVVLAGPLFGAIAGRWVDVAAPDRFQREETFGERRPSFGVTLATVLLPVVLMLAKALADIFASDGSLWLTVFDTLGTPLVALLIGVLVAMLTLGRAAGMDRGRVAKTVESSLPAVAGIILIVAAGGGFKQELVDTGIAQVVAGWVSHSGLSVLVLAWLVAVFIRVATGSATVATVTASGILAPVAHHLSTGETSLLVLAIGAGSLFFSHVNDAGFWLVKEYFGLTVGQTLKTWSVMETLISVSGLVFVLLLNLVV
ncbi:MAG: GntP family permease [Nocardioidaceae bacterium]